VRGPQLENWVSCRDDCELAIKNDPLNAKASYLLGTSLARLLVFDAAVEALQRAQASADKTHKSAAFRGDIALELRRVRKQQWLHEQEKRRARHEKVRAQLGRLLASRRVAEVFEGGSSAGAREIAEEMDAMVAYVEHVFASVEQDMHPGDVPEYFVCPVSMEIMHDPVTTPNGVSYERSCIEQHLRANGPVDPLTRKRLTLDMLRPNTALREAIQDYLDKNSWAFEH
jgi:STIP1 family protein 1